MPFQIQRFSQFTSLNELKRDILKDRNLLLTGLVRQVQGALGALRDAKDRPVVTDFRMADYAEFATKVSPGVGFSENISKILRRLTLDQQAFAMANEPLFEMLDLWLKNPANPGREVTTGRLYGGVPACP